MDVATIVRAAMPEATEGDIDFVMWERTPFPFAKLSARSIYKAASRTRRAYDNGVKLCLLCDNKAIDGEMECKKCFDRLAEIREV